MKKEMIRAEIRSLIKPLDPNIQNEIWGLINELVQKEIDQR